MNWLSFLFGLAVGALAIVTVLFVWVVTETRRNQKVVRR